jgi:hypothetical protein
MLFIMKQTKKYKGGHVFYYSVLPKICGVGVHENDCIPSTLYFLGILTYEAAAELARQREDGIFDVSILDWLDEQFPDESHHVSNLILDFRIFFVRKSRRRRSVFDEVALESANNNFMAKLDFVLPYDKMGVMAGCLRRSQDNQASVIGHICCIIKNEYGELFIIDPQEGYCVAIHTIRDALRFLEHVGYHELVLYVQQDVVEEFNKNSPQLLRGPNKYSLPTAFDTSRLISINRKHTENN